MQVRDLIRSCERSLPGLKFEHLGQGRYEVSFPWPSSEDPQILKAIRRGDHETANRLRQRKGLKKEVRTWQFPPLQILDYWTNPKFMGFIVDEYPWPEEVLTTVENLMEKWTASAVALLNQQCVGYDIPWHLARELIRHRFRRLAPLANRLSEQVRDCTYSKSTWAYGKSPRPSSKVHICHRSLPWCGARPKNLETFEVRSGHNPMCLRCRPLGPDEQVIGFYHKELEYPEPT